jgi:hypothetical protein
MAKSGCGPGSVQRLLIENIADLKHWLCCGRAVDPDSMMSLDPYPDSQSGSRRAKMIHKNRKKVIN